MWYKHLVGRSVRMTIPELVILLKRLIVEVIEVYSGGEEIDFD